MKWVWIDIATFVVASLGALASADLGDWWWGMLSAWTSGAMFIFSIADFRDYARRRAGLLLND